MRRTAGPPAVLRCALAAGISHPPLLVDSSKSRKGSASPPLPWIRRSAKHFSAIATRKAPQHCYDHEPADASPAVKAQQFRDPLASPVEPQMLTAAVAAALGNLSVAVLPETTRRFFGDWSPTGRTGAPSLLLCQLTCWSQVSTEMFRPPGYGRTEGIEPGAIRGAIPSVPAPWGARQAAGWVTSFQPGTLPFQAVSR